ncbi:MAG: rhomboid family intramembrane serine protease [Candidatus Microthrix subdominans]|jgi:membrane associated rhomboid family serine protease|nr:rhomboid family intramembrane serine protease [Candidatus Microthrix sp.]MBK9559471.1 rhomboid family intramembrane serine protease [Candidatus Microthrix sp.]
MATQPSPLTPAESAPAGGPLADLPAWLRPATPVLVMLAMMWTVEIVDVALRGRLDRFGVHPREFSGLTGIVVAPFLHAGFGHLIANTVPFLVLGAIVAYTGLRQFALVTAIVMVGSGAGMWLFGTSNSVQVGASGLVFGYLTYLLTRGFIAQKLSWILGALLIGLLYGSLLWGLIPRHGVSFSGHLFGALSGVGAASLLHRSTDDPIDLPR